MAHIAHHQEKEGFMRLVFALVAAGGIAVSTTFQALANGTSINDLPQTMNCRESFPFSATDYSPSCATAISKTDSDIEQLTSLLEGRCDGTLEITADTYTPVEGKCNGNAASGYDYGRQRTVTCVCSGNSSGMPANATSAAP
jgi:hypothetical protein